MKIQVEVDVPTLDDVQLVKAVESKLAEAVSSAVSKRLNEYERFFGVDQPELRSRWESAVRAELAKRAAAFCDTLKIETVVTPNG